MTYIGDALKGDTLYHFFTTVKSDGAPTTLAGTPAIRAYENNSTTQTTAGLTLTTDFDGVTGLNLVTIATSNAAYSAGKDYTVTIEAGTVNSVSVVGYKICSFSLENRKGIARATLTRGMNNDEAAAEDMSLVYLIAASLAGKKWAISGGTITFYESDGTTVLFTRPIAGTAGVDPLTSMG